MTYGATGLNTATFVQQKLTHSDFPLFLIPLHKMLLLLISIDHLKDFSFASKLTEL